MSGECNTLLDTPNLHLHNIFSQPLSAQFIQEAETTIVALLEKANLSQLQVSLLYI